MSWKLEGSYFETCSCRAICPCTASLSYGATYDRCRVTLVFNIKVGEVEGTDVSGLTVAAVADTPQVMTDGNWRTGVFIDAAATDEQAKKLDAVDFEIEDIVPFGSQSGEPARLTGIFHPAGSELAVARATRSKIDAFGIQYQGDAAFSTSRFSWAA
jgi:hypothetical protein